MSHPDPRLLLAEILSAQKELREEIISRMEDRIDSAICEAEAFEIEAPGAPEIAAILIGLEFAAVGVARLKARARS